MQKQKNKPCYTGNERVRERSISCVYDDVYEHPVGIKIENEIGPEDDDPSIPQLSPSPEQKRYEKELVMRVIDGDLEAAAELFTDVCKQVFAGVVLRSQPGNWITADELCNDVYVHLAANNWEKLRNFQFKCGIKTWFWTVSLHLVYRKFRKEKRHTQNTVEFEYVENQLSAETDVAEESNEVLFRAEGGGDFTLDSSEFITVVRNALTKMKNAYYRELIIHRALKGLSSFETAKILNRSPCAVDQGYCRAKRELRRLISRMQTDKTTV